MVKVPENRRVPPGRFPRQVFLLLFFARLHVVEYPVPHDEQARDDHVGQEPRAEECPGDDELVVHRAHLRQER